MPTPVSAGIIPHSVNELTSSWARREEKRVDSLTPEGKSLLARILHCVSIFKIKYIVVWFS